MEEASRWLLRARETLSRAEQEQLLGWLRSAPENAAAMELVCRSWTLSGEAARTKAMEPQLLRAQRLLVTAPAPPAPTVPPGVRPRHISSTPAFLAGLALCLAGVAAWVLWDMTAVQRVYATDRATQLSATLPDGTRLRLDASTRLDVRFTLFQRSVRVLKGEAELDIGRDRRPMRVQTRALEIRDLGTRFTVRDRFGSLRVVLIDGEIELRQPARGRRVEHLKPGEEATLADADPRVVIGPADLQAALAWQHGRLVFKNTALADVLQEFRVHTPHEIALADPALERLRVSGSYDAQDATSFIKAVCALYSLSWRQTGPSRFEISVGPPPARSLTHRPR